MDIIDRILMSMTIDIMDIIDGIKLLMGLMMFNCEVGGLGTEGCLPLVFFALWGVLHFLCQLPKFGS